MSCDSQSPIASVIVAAYNAAAHLPATLASVRAQTLEALEVIVVDDGSTDDTAAVVARLAREDPRIRLLRQSNAGVGAARNAALQLARGRYIAPLDADDLWAPTKLARQVECLENGGPRVGMVYCWFERIDDQDRRISYGHPYTMEGAVLAPLLLSNVLGNASVPLIRTSVLAEIGGYLTRDEQGGAQGCEDWDLYLRIAERYHVHLVPEYLVGYRQQVSGMSVNRSTMEQSYHCVFRRARARLPAVPAEMFRWSEGAFYSYLASKSYQWCRYGWTLRALARAWRADPALVLSPRLRRFALGSIVHPLTRNRFRFRRVPAHEEDGAPPLRADVRPEQLSTLERIQLRRSLSAVAPSLDAGVDA